MNITNEQPDPSKGDEVSLPEFGYRKTGVVIKNNVILWDDETEEDWSGNWHIFFTNGGKIDETKN